jgi:hypothetical protein
MSNMNTRRRLAAAFAIGSMVSFVPMLSGAAHAAPRPPDHSSFPGGCVDYWTGKDYPNNAHRVDLNGTVWRCVNGKWYSTVGARDGGAGRVPGASTMAPPPRG